VRIIPRGRKENWGSGPLSGGEKKERLREKRLRKNGRGERGHPEKGKKREIDLKGKKRRTKHQESWEKTLGLRIPLRGSVTTPGSPLVLKTQEAPSGEKEEKGSETRKGGGGCIK